VKIEKKTFLTMDEKYIEPLVVKCYDTGLPGLFRGNKLKFNWSSWVLCELAFDKTNVIHHAIFTNFHCDNFEDPGIARKITVSLWNPSYEDEEYRQEFKLDSLWYWKPVQVVLENP
jgi:hypothetical protein